jgi:hypothetical protein
MMTKSGSGNGWRSAQWTIIAALILAGFTGGVTLWRQFTVMQERQEYLMRLNDSQNQIINQWQDSVRSLQQATAVAAQADLMVDRKLKEHDDFLREILGRLRKVEQEHRE